MITRRLRVGSLELAWHRSPGRGPAVVLLHGNSCSARSFARQLEGPLGQRLALTALDLPGHGVSADALDPANTYSVPGYAQALLGAVQQLGLERAIFVGWSLGGHVVLEAAPDLPDAGGFMIIATPPFAHPPDLAAAFHPHPILPTLFAAELTPGQQGAFVEAVYSRAGNEEEELLADLRRTDGRARAALAASITPGSYRDEIEVMRTLDRPLAVAIGAADPLVNRDYLVRLAPPTLWRSALQIIPNAGHAPHWENAPEFDVMLETFAHECCRSSRCPGPFRAP